ncbi:MAG: hypothetical protein WCT03_18850 [Candidatus Obscuribacterales bacterium]
MSIFSAAFFQHSASVFAIEEGADVEALSMGALSVFSATPAVALLNEAAIKLNVMIAISLCV